MKKYILAILSFLFMVIIFSSCGKDDLPKEEMPPDYTGPVEGMLQIGTTKSLGNFNLGKGQTILIGSEGMELGLEEMEISQELESSSSLSISAAPILSHTYGELISPISPLISIHISNESNEFETLYKISIPIEDEPEDDEFMMAFYYDAATGELEGIPTVAYQSNKLTIATTHFSDFFITKVKLALLPDKIFTGFKPEINGWPYTNYGTYYNPGGICAGMSLTAMYIYGQGDGNLYSLADNDQFPGSPTPNFWQDDAQGIIFGNYGQQVYGRIFKVWKSDIWLEGLDDAITYRCFAYSMSITGEPQYIGVSERNVGGGHAMVAYAIDEHQIFVYDPNYPGQQDRIVNFKGNTSGDFDPYNSGNNAEDIANGNGTSYDLITYASKSALIPNESLAGPYQKYLDHTLWEDNFAVKNLELVLSDKDDKIISRSANPEMVCAEKEVKLGFHDPITNIELGAVFYNSSFEPIEGIVTLNEDEETIIGVYVAGKNGSAWDWIGFKWFSVKYTKNIYSIDIHVQPDEVTTIESINGGNPFNLTYDDLSIDGKVINENGEINGNSIAISYDDNDNSSHSNTIIELTFEDIANPIKIVGFHMTKVQTYNSGKIITSSVSGENIPFEVTDWGGYGVTYIYSFNGNISQYLTEFKWETNSATETQEAVSYTSDGEIYITLEFTP